MKYETKRLINLFFLLFLLNFFHSIIEGLLQQIFTFDIIGIMLLFYLISSFIAIYFYYPFFLRKGVFSNPVYFRDSGYIFLFFLILEFINRLM